MSTNDPLSRVWVYFLVVLLTTAMVGGVANAASTESVGEPHGDAVHRAHDLDASGNVSSIAIDDPLNDSEYRVRKPVAFTASVSTQGGDVDVIEWDFNGDGFVDATGTEVTHTYSETGTYTVSATRIDESGATSEATVDVNITLTGPPVVASWTNGSTVEHDVRRVPTGRRVSVVIPPGATDLTVFVNRTRIAPNGTTMLDVRTEGETRANTAMTVYLGAVSRDAIFYANTSRTEPLAPGETLDAGTLRRTSDGNVTVETTTATRSITTIERPTLVERIRWKVNVLLDPLDVVV